MIIKKYQLFSNVKDFIIKNKNDYDYVYVLGYHHFQNPIEKFFNQLKYYMKYDERSKIFIKNLRFLFNELMSFDLIKKSIRKAIKYIELKSYVNYFKYSLKTKEEKMKYIKNPKIVPAVIIKYISL